MLDFLADNIVIVVLVVVFFVVTRVTRAVRKQQQSSEDGQAEKSWEDEFRDNSPQEETVLNHWEIEKKNKPVIHKAKPKPVKTLAQKLEESSPSPLRAHESAQSADVSGAKNNAHPKTLAPEHHASLSGLEHLPLLKKAFVFSEILAPPKALREE